MCQYFVKADPIAYEQRTRTLRIHGVITSLRLENMAWDILGEMAEGEGCTTNHLIETFHDEIMAHIGEIPNFASFLRVTCMRYLRREVTAAERAGRGLSVLPKAVALALAPAAATGPSAARLTR